MPPFPLKRFAFLTGIAALLSGCVLLPMSDGIDRSVDAPTDRVFQATVDVLRTRGFTLKERNRTEGRILTNRRPVETGTARSPRPVEQAEVHIEADGTQTEVYLLLRFVDQVSGPPRRVPNDGDDERADDIASAVFDRSYDADTVYNDYFKAIADRVQALQATGPS